MFQPRQFSEYVAPPEMALTPDTPGRPRTTWLHQACADMDLPVTDAYIFVRPGHDGQSSLRPLGYDEYFTFTARC